MPRLPNQAARTTTSAEGTYAAQGNSFQDSSPNTSSDCTFSRFYSAPASFLLVIRRAQLLPFRHTRLLSPFSFFFFIHRPINPFRATRLTLFVPPSSTFHRAAVYSPKVSELHPPPDRLVLSPTTSPTAISSSPPSIRRRLDNHHTRITNDAR